MKNLLNIKSILAIILLLTGSISYAATITATQAGNWETSSTWDLNRTPASGDLIIINSGITVTVSSNIETISGGSVTMEIYGGGVLSFAKNATLTLDANSLVTVNSATTNLNSENNNSPNQKITIGTTEAWNSKNGILDPTLVSEIGTLPIDLISYSVDKCTLFFSTASQENVESFTIELFDENMIKIGEQYAEPCNCLTVKHYSINIENSEARYVRLVETDYDGTSVYFSYLTLKNTISIDSNEESIFYTMEGRILTSSYQGLKPGVYIHKGEKIIKAAR